MGLTATHPNTRGPVPAFDPLVSGFMKLGELIRTHKKKIAKVPVPQPNSVITEDSQPTSGQPATQRKQPKGLGKNEKGDLHAVERASFKDNPPCRRAGHRQGAVLLP